MKTMGGMGKEVVLKSEPLSIEVAPKPLNFTYDNWLPAFDVKLDGNLSKTFVKDGDVAEYKLNIKGLMCIPPFDEESAPHFGLLSKIAAKNHLKELSMGMSADFETAIMFGATYIRVGSALFGKRV